ncbi:MAG: hypothetical protein JW850_20750 [Thermoflexales bacterium]|nr:hypothetical protein [Thermoflexales bacterium]
MRNARRGGRGRPRLAQASLRISIDLRLRPGEDDDLIAYFQSVPPRQRAPVVKSALRSGGMQIVNAGLPGEDDDLDEIAGNLLF